MIHNYILCFVTQTSTIYPNDQQFNSICTYPYDFNILKIYFKIRQSQNWRITQTFSNYCNLDLSLDTITHINLFQKKTIVWNVSETSHNISHIQFHDMRQNILNYMNNTSIPDSCMASIYNNYTQYNAYLAFSMGLPKSAQHIADSNVYYIKSNQTSKNPIHITNIKYLTEIVLYQNDVLNFINLVPLCHILCVPFHSTSRHYFHYNTHKPHQEIMVSLYLDIPFKHINFSNMNFYYRFGLWIFSFEYK